MGKPNCHLPSKVWCIKFKDPDPPAGRDQIDEANTHYINKKLEKVYEDINDKRPRSC